MTSQRWQWRRGVVVRDNDWAIYNNAHISALGCDIEHIALTVAFRWQLRGKFKAHVDGIICNGVQKPVNYSWTRWVRVGIYTGSGTILTFVTGLWIPGTVYIACSLLLVCLIENHGRLLKWSPVILGNTLLRERQNWATHNNFRHLEMVTNNRAHVQMF
jgi:hypothetical protein